MRDLDRCCISAGMACTHCGIAMPESSDSPRLCPAVNEDVSREEVKQSSPYNYETGEYEGKRRTCRREGCDEPVKGILSNYCSDTCESISLRRAAKRLEELRDD